MSKAIEIGDMKWCGSDLKRKFKSLHSFKSLSHSFESWFLFEILNNFYYNASFETFMKVEK